jgi:hypothetical protein
LHLFGWIRLAIGGFELVDYGDESLYGPKLEVVACFLIVGDEILLENFGVVASFYDFLVKIGLFLSQIVLHPIAVRFACNINYTNIKYQIL